MYQNSLVLISIIEIMTSKLSIHNIDKHFINNIAFIFVSHPGSLGPDGTVEFVLKDTNSYICNIAYKNTDNYVDYVSLKTKLSEYGFIFDIDKNIDCFEKIYLGGYGNDLYVNDKYILDFYRFTYGDLPVTVFQKWHDIANYILCTQ